MIILEVPAPKFSIFRHGVMAKTKKKINFSLYFVTMLFCNTISLHSNSHGFSSREVGWGRDTLPPSSQHSAYYIPLENILPLPKLHSSLTK